MYQIVSYKNKPLKNNNSFYPNQNGTVSNHTSSSSNQEVHMAIGTTQMNVNITTGLFHLMPFAHGCASKDPLKVEYLYDIDLKKCIKKCNDNDECNYLVFKNLPKTNNKLHVCELINDDKATCSG